MSNFLLAAGSVGLEAGQSALGSVGSVTGASSVELPALVGNLINVVLAALGIVFVALVIYAGILYFSSTGDDKAIKKAKDILKTAIMGMVIIVAAYAVSNYVMGALVRVSSPPSTSSSSS